MAVCCWYAYVPGEGCKHCGNVLPWDQKNPPKPTPLPAEAVAKLKAGDVVLLTDAYGSAPSKGKVVRLYPHSVEVVPECWWDMNSPPSQAMPQAYVVGVL